MRFVNLLQSINGLQLNNNFAGHQKIDAISAIQTHLLVNNGKLLLSFNG